MITPGEFAAQWDEPLIKLDQSFIKEMDLPQEAIIFLLEAGLPLDCAPFMSFKQVAGGLKYIHDVYILRREHLTPQERERLAPYRMIGSDGEGSPICIDIAHSGQLVILDHSNSFKSARFINTSVPQLAECILIYRNLVEASQDENGEDAWLDGNIPAHMKQEAIAQIIQANAVALNDDCFWRLELNNLG